MRPPSLRTALLWLIGFSLTASICCLALAILLGLTARKDATDRSSRRMTAQADGLVRQIEADLGLFDLALHDASARRDGPSLELPLTARYIGFMNVLNEVGDVIADSRSNVSRPANFAGRDYFQDQQKNPIDSLMIGRPFGTAPDQHASIPITRRLTAPDGSFAGVVVAGVRLSWLSDLLTREAAGPSPSVTVRRADGVILMRTPTDDDAIGRLSPNDPAWQAFLQDGPPFATDASGGVRLFRRIGASPLVLELAVDHASIVVEERPWLILLPPLVLIPGLFVLALAFLAYRVLRRGSQIEAATRAANDEHMRLLANMSHELRTPLTGILGQAEMMTEEGGLTEPQMTRLTRLTEAGTMMRNIVNRVIDVASLDNLVHTYVLKPCDLDLLILTCLGMVEGEARRKGLRLTSEVDPATPRKVMLARDLVQQVVVNLLMNAVKFTATGAVTLRVMGDTTRLWFEVADTGPGIPAGKRRRLFREYDRLDMPEFRSESTGLGLSITERFVRRMGGRIGSVENPGGGSVFWFELPTATHTAATPVPAADISPPEEPAPEPEPLRILLADDLDLTRSVTAGYLRSSGHSVTEVSDGETAISEVRKRHFDLMLTDMRMPVVDGLEVTRRIRALPGARGRIPVVLVSADLIAIGRGESGQTGVDVCVIKPFTRAELLAAVANAARLRPALAEGLPDHPLVDEATLGELRKYLSPAAFAAHLDMAARRIEDLLVLLETPDATPAVDAIHDLVGIAGLLGFKALSSCLRRFDIAEDRAGPEAALREAAADAIEVLRRQVVEVA
jgi:signal transduction histidine kinase/CheY-like chemotaxis protein